MEVHEYILTRHLPARHFRATMRVRLKMRVKMEVRVRRRVRIMSLRASSAYGYVLRGSIGQPEYITVKEYNNLLKFMNSRINIEVSRLIYHVRTFMFRGSQ